MTFAPTIGAALPFLAGAFGAAALVAFLLTPAVRSIARRLDVVDVPDERRVNTRPVPRGGGVAVVAAFVVVAAAALAWLGGDAELVFPASLDGPAIIALLAGAVGAAMIGAIDDYLQIRARWQLAGQLLIAVWAVALGVTIDVLSTPFGSPVDLPPVVAAGFTVFWIMGMINAINFIDGLDGLSSGIGLIAALTLGVVSLTTSVGPSGQPVVGVLCFALAGALLGFLRWNFHPASIFAGTSGTMFLGYTLALLATVGTAKVPVALLVLGVPIIDTFWIIVRRVASGRMPFSPDRGHIHHRLLDLGLSHRQAVLAIYAICLGLAVVALVLPSRSQPYAFAGLVVVSGVIVTALARRTMATSGLSAESYEDDQAATRPGDDAPSPPAPAGSESAHEPGHAADADDPRLAVAGRSARSRAGRGGIEEARGPTR